MIGSCKSLASLILIGLCVGFSSSAAAPKQAHSDPSSVSTGANLGESVRIPYEAFTLPNGLRVLVHTDRKAPVVAVSVWYDIGSKQEPKGKTGFAHLFEHLMFNGSENADDDFFKPMQEVGATDMNGSTWFDRTNYFETVPTGALEKTLYLESDRMGYLLGAVTQAKLDNQRGVVQNEKRKNDNQPYGMVSYKQTEALFPADHPYGHDTIGSMADLDAASVDDVKGWFRQHYGPNNAVLALAGDIDLATAKRLVEQYFGGIPRGPGASPVVAPIPTLAARKDEVLRDRVSTTRLYRTWVVPGLNDPDTIPLSIGASVLGGLASSRLDNALVKREQLAVQVTAGVQTFAQMSQFEVTADVKPGVEPAVVAKRLDALIAELIDKGPTAAEVGRVVTQNAAGTVKSLEPVGGKAQTLAEGLLYSNDPDKYAKDLKAYAAATPSQIKAVLRKWLSRPVYALTVEPGEREAYVEASASMPVKAKPETSAAASAEPPIVKRAPAPAVGEIAALRFPEVSHSNLSNGIEIIYAQRTAVPATQVSLSFDAGTAADPELAQGTAALMTALLKEGTTDLDSIAIAERQETLGASIGAGSSLDTTAVGLSALSENLAPSLDLFTDIALRPAFAGPEVERVRAQMLAAIDAELTSPQAMAGRVLSPALYGPNHPYARMARGTPESVKALTPYRSRGTTWETASEAALTISCVESLIGELRNRQMIDDSRVGLSGFSRMGMRTLQVLALGNSRIAAATITDSTSDSISTYTSQYGFGMPAFDAPETNRSSSMPLIGAPPWGKQTKLWLERSSFFSLDRVEAPVRFEYHGFGMVSFDTFALLRRMGRPAEMVFVPGESHWPSTSRGRYSMRQGIAEWYDFWLGDNLPLDTEQAARWRALRRSPSDTISVDRPAARQWQSSERASASEQFGN
jgi:zinc protease